MKTTRIIFIIFCFVFCIQTSGWTACSTERPQTGLRAFSLSPDGTHIAALAEDGTLFGWDVSSGTLNEIQACFITGGLSTSLVFSPDSRLLAVPDSFGEIKIFNIASGQMVSNLVDTMHRIQGLVFSGNGRRLAVAHEKGVSVWSVEEKKELLSIPEIVDRFALALNGVGDLLAVDGKSGIELWAVDTDHLLRTIKLSEQQWAEAIVFANR